MSGPGVPSSAPSRRQKRMGPAPFASFEDLSDEVRSRLDSPEDKSGTASVVRLPGIREDATPITPSRVDPTQEFIYAGISLVGAPPTPVVSAPPSVPLTPPSTTISSLSTPQESLTSNKMSLQTPSTPRIDISRASSSSHHEDSRESTPERELFDGNNQGGAKLGLAFKEEGTLDLRSSTEELDFQEPQEKLKVQKKRSQSPAFHDDSLHQRKDSQCSEIGLLSISGRTSRLSSIGSQCSTHSRISNVSHLSIVSGQSGRSPSPHKMLLETSFCGYKSPVNNPQVGQTGMKFEADVLEQVLLSRKHDPREVVMAEGISVKMKNTEEKPKPEVEKILKKPQSLVDHKVTVTIDKPPSNDKITSADKSKLPGKYVSPSGVEYTYIPLKGPIPKDLNKEINLKPKLREIKSANVYSKTAVQNKTTKDNINKTKPKSASSSPSVTKSNTTIMSPLERKDEPKYIRIKLKPDHLYDDDSTSTSNIQKPVRLNLRDSTQKPQVVTTTVKDESNKLHTIPKVESQHKISYDTISTSSKSTPGHNMGREANVESKSPSPALSRKSSFTSLFKSRETIVSPESPTIPGLRRKVSLTGMLRDAGESLRDRTRSRSKSRERDKSSTAPSSTESIDSKTKQPKSVLSIFKPKKSGSTTKVKSNSNQSTPEVLNDLDGITSVEFKFNTEANLPSPKKYYETPLHGESIRIPLHSPTHYEERGILQDLKSSSQESQETVIDTTQRVEVTIDNDIDKKSKNETKREIDITNRQSSTSSDNVVFSTQLGSSNDLFITKLPKEKQSKRVNDIHNEISICNTNDKIKQLNNKIKIDKSIALDGIPDDFKQSFTIEKTDSINSNTTEVLFTANFLKETAIRDVPECSSTRTIKKSLMSSIANEDRYSSESEKDGEHDYFKVNHGCEDKLENIEPERKGFVHQQDSFDDELPYIPTTLPLERSVAVPIVPVKQRSTYEMKTYPIERPRSTTPINLSTLEDYCEDVVGSINTENIAIAIEKLKICLPRDESTERTNKAKSPRKPGANTNWFAFGDKTQRHDDETEPPPPLPPKGVQKEWINFEEIPERRKPPRRIQTIPSRSNIEIPESVIQDNVIYNYVNPEDCKCECHEIAREREQNKQQEDVVRVQEDEVPLLEDDPGDDDKSAQELVDRIKVDVTADRRSIISDSSLDLSTSIEHHENSNLDPSLRTPFTGDLGLSSNRSSIVSQDEFQSPDITTPNAFSKCS